MTPYALVFLSKTGVQKRHDHYCTTVSMRHAFGSHGDYCEVVT